MQRASNISPANSAIQKSRPFAWPRLALALCLALVASRLFALLVSPLELGPDEAQYWRWAQIPDWGYFSKPPLIAWIIALTTHFFGDAEWAVRLAAPITHALCAAFIGWSAHSLAGKSAGPAAALLYLAAPGVAISSFVMSTDALLLCCAAAALAAALSLRTRPNLIAGLALGAALGLGLLAKYAMVYTLFALLAGAFADQRLRRGLLSWPAAAGAVLAALIVAPNLYWNATHAFATFHHTAANADLGAARFDPRELGEFLAGQFGVFGPLAFLILPAALWARRTPAEADAAASDARAGLAVKPLLAAMIITPLAIVSVEALVNRANANWAAIAYPAASVLVAVWCVTRARPRLLAAAIGVNLVLSLLACAGTVAPRLVDQIGASNAIKRTRGWDDLTRSIAQAAAEGPEQAGARYQAIVFDNRLIFHEADYYGRTRLMPPLKMWRRTAGPVNHAQATAPLAPGQGPFLVALSSPANKAMVGDDFQRFTPVGGATVFLGGKKKRHVDFYEAEGFAPKPRDSAFDRKWSASAAEKPE